MAIIKAAIGDGAWELWDATQVSFLGRGNGIQVPDGDHAYSEDDRFPDGWDFCHTHFTEEPFRDPQVEGNPPTELFRIVRWVKWFHPTHDECHLLVTDGPVYICNDSGDTIEALR